MRAPLLCRVLWVCWCCLPGRPAAAQVLAEYVPSRAQPPAPQREFRALWIATVKNIDWPSRPGLSPEQQRSELVALLDQAKRIRLNAIFLQVRPACDALYSSSLEPWSEYLSGRMGQAPSPFYDPLRFAVQEAHERGLELHAWLNPYRARHSTALSPVSRDHITRTKPHLVRSYGKSLWLDPSEREVQEHLLGVILDLVRRYDIDGIHFDDYFYPYPEKDAAGHPLPFPDWSSWKRYKDAGGRLDREDWRRENVNLFVMRVGQSIRTVRSSVKFGISPFGIWRPGSPPQIKGLDAYNVIFADSRKWLRQGWVDYLAPQLYWSEEPRETSFSALLRWWAGENVQHRHLWPGLDLTRLGPNRGAEEILNQIRATRRQAGADGTVFWGLRPLLENRRGLRDTLLQQTYAEAALPPVSPWMDSQPPVRPYLLPQAARDGGMKVTARPIGAEPAWLWLLQTRSAGKWTTEIRPGTQTETTFLLPTRPEVIALRAIDRCGNASPPAVLERKQEKVN